MTPLKARVFLLILVFGGACSAFAWAQTTSDENSGIWIEKLHDCDGRDYWPAPMADDEKKCQAVAEKVMTRLKSRGLLASPETARYFVRFAYENHFPEIPGRYEGTWFGNTFQIGPATVWGITGRVYWSEDPNAMKWDYRSDWFLLKERDYYRLTSETGVEFTTCLEMGHKTFEKELGNCDRIRSPRAHDRCAEEAYLWSSASSDKCEEKKKSRDSELYKMVFTPRGLSASLTGFDACSRNVYDAQGKFDPDQTECRANQIVQMIEEMKFIRSSHPIRPPTRRGRSEMGERSYKTDKLREYSASFCHVAEEIFRLASRQVGTQRAIQCEGSYSIIATTTDETVAKILIFEPDRGRRFGNWPLMNPGVYVLIRVNREVGERAWSDSFRLRFERFYERMRPHNEDVSVAPNYDERFMFFPVMAGESLGDIAHFMAAVSTV